MRSYTGFVWRPGFLSFWMGDADVVCRLRSDAKMAMSKTSCEVLVDSDVTMIAKINS